jgi:hypothetical protein
MKTLRKIIGVVAIASLIGLSFTACGDGSGGGGGGGGIKVTINPSNVFVAKGGNVTFTATVTGPNNPDQTVTWSIVESSIRSGTTIDANTGVLDVSSLESIDKFTVKAVSTVDITKSGTATVTVDKTLVEILTLLKNTAESNGTYTFEVSSNESFSAAQSQILSYDGKDNVTVILKGKGGERIISMNVFWGCTLFTVENGVTLVLDENITLQGRSSNDRMLVKVNTGGKLLMKNGSKITGNSGGAQGGGVCVAGIFEMIGGEISGNKTGLLTDYRGAGVYVDTGGTFTMSGGEISGNSTAGYGSGVCVSGTFEMSGGKIFDNTSTEYGGTVYLTGNAIFTLSGGEIFENTGTAGIGVSVGGNGATFTMTSGKIYDNSSAGVALSLNTTFEMNGGEISGNKGGVSLSSTSAFTMKGGEIAGNTGNGVYVSGIFNMFSGKISRNTSSNGGGVCVGNNTNAVFNMRGGEISGNTATSQGGGLYLYNGKFRISGGTIYGSNEAEDIKNTDPSGAALGRMNSDISAEYGTFDENDNWIKAGNIFTGILGYYNDTLKVLEGVKQ